MDGNSITFNVFFIETFPKLDIFNSQEKLLKQCGWLSVRQLVAFHSLVIIFKTITEQKPVFLHKTLSKRFNYNTRAAAGGSIVFNHAISGDIAKSGYVCRSTLAWNLLPTHVRRADSLRSFKQELKTCIKNYVVN